MATVTPADIVRINADHLPFHEEYGVVTGPTEDFETNYDVYVDVQHRVNTNGNWYTTEPREHVAFKNTEIEFMPHSQQRICIDGAYWTPAVLRDIAYHTIMGLIRPNNENRKPNDWRVDNLQELMANVPTAFDYRLGML